MVGIIFQVLNNRNGLYGALGDLGRTVDRFRQILEHETPVVFPGA
jgi:hypothetical protein